MQAKITFDKIKGVDEEEIAIFIQEALTSWGGQYYPSDPLFDSLEIKRIKIGAVTHSFEE